jgi:LysM repeat protein
MRSTLFGIGAVAVAVTVGASCGSSGEGAVTNTTAIQIGATNYVTIPPTASTLSPAVTTAGAQPEQEYIVASGDYPATIAQKFNVPFQALMDLNGWVLNGQMAVGFPPAGTPIRIPAGGTLVGEPVPAPTVAGTPGVTTPGVTAAGTVPTATSPVFTAAPTTTLSAACVGEEYTIVASDTSRSKVASNFGVTVQALDAANASTPGYSAFYPGLVIKIPSKAEGC